MKKLKYVLGAATLAAALGVAGGASAQWWGGSPWGGSPFGGSPWGGSPWGGSPWGGSPFSPMGMGSPISPFGGFPGMGW